MTHKSLVSIGLLAMAACVPQQRDARTAAEQQQSECRGGCSAEDAQRLRAMHIDGAEPLYSHVLGGPNSVERRLIGAQLHVSPVNGVTPEWLGETLRCHQAKALLSSAPDAADPYVMPGRWIDIDVKSHKDGGLVVTLETDDVDSAKQVLERAKASAAAAQNGPATTPVCDG